MFEEHARELAKNGPSKITCAQTSVVSSEQTNCFLKKEYKGKVFTVSRLTKLAPFSPRSTFSIKVCDHGTALDGKSRYNDGSTENLVLPRLAEATAVREIRSTRAIKPVTVQMAPAADANPQMFQLSREWKVPRLNFPIALGPLALLNISFLASDDDLGCEDFLVGQPVLHHLGIDSCTLREKQGEELYEISLDDFDYSKARGQLRTFGQIILS